MKITKLYYCIIANMYVVVLLCYQFCKNPQGFLNTQHSTTRLCIHICAHSPYRSTVSDF